MIEDLRKDISAILYERVASPLAGAFMLSWIAFNWRLLLVMFDGETPVTERIELINSTYICLQNNFIYPALSSAIVVALYPLLGSGAYWWWERWDSWKRKKKLKIEDSEPISKEKQLKLLAEIRTKERELSDLMSEIEAERNALRKQLEESLSEDSVNKRTIDELRSSISTLEQARTTLEQKLKEVTEEHSRTISELTRAKDELENFTKTGQALQDTISAHIDRIVTLEATNAESTKACAELEKKNKSLLDDLGKYAKFAEQFAVLIQQAEKPEGFLRRYGLRDVRVKNESEALSDAFGVRSPDSELVKKLGDLQKLLPSNTGLRK